MRRLEAANAFLPGFVARYNCRFARPPALCEDAHQGPPGAESLRLATCQQYTRVLSKSLSCQFRGLLYQVDTGGRAGLCAARGAGDAARTSRTNPVVLLQGQRRLVYRTFEPAPIPAEERIADDKTVDLAVELANQRRAAKQRHINAHNSKFPPAADTDGRTPPEHLLMS